MNKCKNCQKETENKIACSQKCIAILNSKKRIGTHRSEETKRKISESSLKKSKPSRQSKLLNLEDKNIVRQLNLLNRNVRTEEGFKRHLTNIDKLKSEDYSNLSFERLRKRVIIDQDYKCKKCNLDKWLGENITFELNHIDGDNKNNSKENLEILCPNCHSLTPNWRGKNIAKGNKKVGDEELLEALKNSTNTRQALIKVGLTPKGKNYLRCQNILKKHLNNKEDL